MIGLPAVLAGGAGVVMATAAALSYRAALRPELPATRWSRPLPRPVRGALERHSVVRAVRVLTLVASVALAAAMATTGGRIDGRGAVVALTAAALVGAPFVRAVNPIRLFATTTPAPDGAAIGWPAVAWAVVLAAVLAAPRDGVVLASALLVHLVAQSLLARRDDAGRPARDDPVEALAALVGQVAPVGRDPAGRTAWRNPVVAAAHAAPGAPGLGTTAVLAGLTLSAHAATPATPTFVVAAAGAGAVLRLGLIRPWFAGALAPIAAAYGLLAGGRWLPPVDLVAFVALHAVAVTVLHRQAIARHDPRTARAVQFPPRAAVVVSVLAGLAVIAAG